MDNKKRKEKNKKIERIRKNRKYRNKNFLGFIIDAIFITIIIISCVLECKNIIKIKDFLGNNLVFDIIIELLPVIITIISISISLKKEEIYGVTMNEFAILANKMFSFFHMVIIMLVSFILYTIFRLFSTNLPSLVLIIVVLMYTLIFSYQEIPLLTQNKRIIKKIIKRAYKKRNPSDLLLQQRDENTLAKIIQNMILTEGIKTSYISLNKNKKCNIELVDDLLDYQNEYILNAIADLKILPNNFNGTYGEIELTKAIKIGYENVISLLKNDFLKTESVDFNIYNVRKLTIAMLNLHKICEVLNHQNVENDMMDKIILRVLTSGSFVENSNNKLLSFVISMSVSSLRKGEIWFIKYLRDNALYPEIIFSFESNQLGLFISIFIAHLLNKNLLSKQNEKNIKAFLNESVKRTNGYGRNWNQLLSDMLIYPPTNELLNSINTLLMMYNSIFDISYYFPYNYTIVDMANNFTKENIIEAWLEMIFSSPFLNMNTINIEETIKDVINQFTAEERELLVNTLTNKWIRNEKFNINYKTSFLNNFGNCSSKIELTLNGQRIFNYLVKCRKKFYLENKIENNKNKDNIGLTKKEISNSFIEFKKATPFFDENISINNEQSKCFVWTLKKFPNENEFLSFLKLLQRSLKVFFRDQLKMRSHNLSVENNVLTEEQIEKILSFKPDKRSELIGIIRNNSNLDSIYKIKYTENIPILPSNFFYKNDAIKFNIEYDEEHSTIRKLTNDEIDQIIDNEYELINGSYRYYDFFGVQKGSILLTRSELKNLLQDEMRCLIIVFKIKIIVKQEECLWLNMKSDN